ncbi:uncharacterized protein UPF0102 [Murinocardiopsis flavida]|uniref:UPF0102 protein CLV63_11496 n=1 Tax=Murinocardiopsis flavida TaxID=645275 RepID=A0A2P8DEL9_9ACTN|nr:uncharacterized protein UPF0102 [Murinocardiopsis flavida]
MTARLLRRTEALGQWGEDAAAAYLKREGMRILARNWRCRHGELDIVASHGGVLVAVEVKTRSSGRFGSPLEAVGPEKRARLRRLALAWTDARAPGGPPRTGARRRANPRWASSGRGSPPGDRRGPGTPPGAHHRLGDPPGNHQQRPGQGEHAGRIGYLRPFGHLERLGIRRRFARLRRIARGVASLFSPVARPPRPSRRSTPAPRIRVDVVSVLAGADGRCYIQHHRGVG